MSAFQSSDLFEKLLEYSVYLWPVVMAAIGVAGVLVMRAGLSHPGLAIVIGATVEVIVQLMQIFSFRFFLAGPDDDFEKHLKTIAALQGVNLLAMGLVAYGVLVLSWIVYKQRNNGQFGRLGN